MSKQRTLEPGSTASATRAAAEARVEVVKSLLAREIEARRLPQRRVSRQLGYGDSYLANLFMKIRGRGPAHLRMDSYLALCTVLQVDPAALLAASAPPATGAEPPAPPLALPGRRELASLVARLAGEELRALALRGLVFAATVNELCAKTGRPEAPKAEEAAGEP